MKTLFCGCAGNLRSLRSFSRPTMRERSKMLFDYAASCQHKYVVVVHSHKCHTFSKIEIHDRHKLQQPAAEAFNLSELLATLF